jgi:hypothetical protein
VAADSNSREAKQVFSDSYWNAYYRKFPDAFRKENGKALNFSQTAEPGTPDALFINIVGAAFIEHKAGRDDQNRRFVFDSWTEKQREFCVWAESIGIPYYLYLTVGTFIRSRTFPRKTFLIRGTEMLAYIQNTDRKSINYSELIEHFGHAMLNYEVMWKVPLFHEFNLLFGKKAQELIRCRMQS